MAHASRRAAGAAVKRADGVTVGAIALAMVLHVRFCLVDARAPTDLGHYYDAFRNLVLTWQQDGRLDLHLVDTPYSLVLAGVAAIMGPSVALVEAVDGLWLLLLLVGAALVARAVRGPVAGAVAALALVAYPQTHVLARTHWIHHPEAAALVGALALWVRAPALPAMGPALGIAALLFLGETIRPTGIPFGVPLGLLVVGAAWARGARRTLAPVVAALVAGVVWQAPSLLTYIAGKAASAEGYARSVTAPWASVVDGFGLPVVVWAVPFALAGLAALRRRDLGAAVAGIGLAWIAGGAVAVAIFHVGPDNFPIAGVALALLAGIGAASLPARGAVTAVALGVVATALVQVPPLLHFDYVSRLPAVLRAPANPGPLNYLRIYWNPVSVEAVLPTADAVCAAAGSDPRARCVVLATRGLFNPSWEDGGSYAMFLSGRPRTSVVTPEVLWFDDGRATGVAPRIHALVDVRCAPGVAPVDGGRFVKQSEKMREMLQARGGTSIATFGDPRACVQTWYALADGGVRVE